ncbi:MAG TPA: dual specificity protein phosphatase family protein [Clostridiales bacterium]|nr:dual specificity protein phosphatase family protein [Clostridiales bacterium]HQP70135.1 dual specificity protein phosphatase family protein [Clostridiales bacterium]
MTYEINWIDKEHIDIKGRIGLGRAPGYGSVRFDDYRSMKEQGISKIYCLQEEEELDYLSGETVKQREQSLKEFEIELIHSPIGDFRVPTPEQAVMLAEMILNDVSEGKSILIHCMGGLGRSGTVAACTLVKFGLKADEAINLVRKIRPGTLETDEQVGFVMEYRASI